MKSHTILSAHTLTGLAMFLALVPVTLPVPGLHELIVTAHGGTESDAHAFMTINMIAGMLAVPFAMRAARSISIGRLVVAALALDAIAFAGMALAPSLTMLYAFRVLDGAAHLPAVTLVMVASHRAAGVRRGGSLGALAAAIMIGVAVGSPVGGWLLQFGATAVFGTGAVILVAAAAIALALGELPPAPGRSPGSSRYAWTRRSPITWIPLAYGFLDRFTIGIFVSTFTLYLTNVIGLTGPQRGVLIALFMLPFALLSYPAGRLADRFGWFAPMLIGNVAFGLLFASYGFVPKQWLPAAMVASGVFSALMFAPNLLLLSDLVKRGFGEGLFGAFQVAGSIGFLVGPAVGGVLVAVTRKAAGTPAYREILLGVGLAAALFSLLSFVALRSFAAQLRGERSSDSFHTPNVAPCRT